MTDAVVVAVHDFGGTGDVLLIAHATGFHGHCYEQMGRSVAGHFRSVAFDFRGHGDTPLPAGWVVDWQGYAEDAESVANSVAGDGPLVGFGHSLGGACLLMLAHRRPALFSHLVLFEPIVVPPMTSPSEAGPSALALAARRRRATFGSYEEAFTNYANKPPMNVLDPDVLWAYVSHGFADDPEGVRLKCAPDVEAATFEQGARQDTWALLPEINIPVLVVAGTLRPGEHPAMMAPPVAEALPDGSLLELSRLDHFGPMSHPAVVGDIVSSFCHGDRA